MSTTPDGGQQPRPIRPNMRAVPNPEQQGPPARLRRLLNRGMRGGRIHRRLALLALSIEHVLTGGTRDTGTSSHVETVIRALGKAAGDQVLQKVAHHLSSLAKKCDSLRATQFILRIHAHYRDGDIISHPDGGVRTVAKTVLDGERLRDQITEEIESGSGRHRRLPTALRQIPLVVLSADGLLLLYFFSGITNVDWGSPFSTALVFAGLLAAMVTGISFAFFRFTGDRLQQYKNDSGTIPLRGLDDVTNLSMGLAGGAMVILAALMFLRMRAEVITTLGPHAGFTAIIVGLALALAGILANTLVIAVHALDGSAETDRLDAFGNAVRPALQAQHDLLEQAAALAPSIAVTIREAERVADDGITAAGYELAEADRVVEAGRAVTQATGPLSEPTTDPNTQDGVIGYRRTNTSPRVDERPVSSTLDQMRTPLTDQQPGDEQAAA